MSRRVLNFAIFFSIFISVYGLLNAYIFTRGWEAFPEVHDFTAWYIGLSVLLTLSFLAGRILERVWLSWLSSIFVWVGALWMAMFAYLLVSLLAIDVLRVINLVVPIFPSFITDNKEMTKHTTGIVVFIGSFLVVVGGYINARTPRLRTLDLSIPKNGNQLTALNIAVASDIHLGTIICKKRLEHIVGIINNLNPDLVLLPGDVVDEDLAPVIKQNLGETLRTIKSKYGVYAITGNHEYIGGADAACNYLSEHGVTMIRDGVVKIAESVYIVGREDLSMRQFDGGRRKPLEELMSQVDKSLPIILMDHQPFNLGDAVHNGADLQLSGHTHHGQLWPFNFITKSVYELSRGYKKKENTHFYVSCGVGTWGPPVRTGNSPEVINIKLRFGEE